MSSLQFNAEKSGSLDEGRRKSALCAFDMSATSHKCPFLQTNKVNRVQQFATSFIATGTHMPYGITQHS